jgi:uncharacterized membrane protein
MTQQNIAVSSQIIEERTASWADKIVFGFMRYWLIFILAASLLFVLVPFAAPAAMYAGWEGLGVLIYKLYAVTCHQLPQRSWFLFGDKLTYTLDEIGQVYPYTDALRLRSFYGTPEMGWKVAWSDRMISFYFMVPVFGLVYAFWHRLHRSPNPISYRLLLLLLLPLMIDGFTHMFSDLIYGVSGGGFRDTNAWLAFITGNAFSDFYAGDHYGTFNWWMRLSTGLLAAWAIAFFAFPWIDRLMQGELDRYQALVATRSEGAELQAAHQHMEAQSTE